ncbi:MAG: hypothetical protein GY778_14660 [bacterium]|nr:hypothetical protein [bacterium]
MNRWSSKVWALFGGIGMLGLISGCDEAGVTDVVFGSLQLAFGIVDLAT